MIGSNSIYFISAVFIMQIIFYIDNEEIYLLIVSLFV